MSWFETLRSQVAYEGWSRVRVDRVRMPDGSEADREVVEHDDAVAVVPVLEDGTVVLLRQYRHPVGGYQLEIPAGKRDVDGEPAARTAQRELEEEIGMRAAELRELLTFRNSAGWTDERTTIFLGTGLEAVGLPDGFTPKAEEADMEVVRLPLDEMVARVRAGDVPDAKTALGILLLTAPQ